jgi:DNA polymerase-3 subunit beta
VIAFNPQFLIDGVSAMQGERVTLSAGDGLKPAVLQGEGSDDYLYLLMPVRLS